MNPNHASKRINKSVPPLGERNITPDNNKIIIKDNLDTIGQSNLHAPSLKDFSQSPLSTDYAGRKRKDKQKDQDYQNWNRTLAQINLELDNNMNEIIYLLGKRKNLIIQKKRKIRQEMEQRLDKTVNGKTNDNSQFEYLNDAQFNKIACFCQNPKNAIKILGRIVQTLPDFNSSNTQQQMKSDTFWSKNRKLQNDIDNMLCKLKQVDKNLQKTNYQVIEICKTLDSIQDNLKSIIGTKATQNVNKVQPLFIAKNKNYQILNQKVKQRQIIKDTKIQYIKMTKQALNDLKKLRQQRINQINIIFGSQNLWELQKIQNKDQGDFTNAFQELLKIKQKDNYLELSEKQAWIQIQNYSREQDILYNEILRKQSDQAKAFHNYNKIMHQRLKYTAILKVFGADDESWKSMSLEPKDLLKKFKQYKGSLKKFIQEDSLIKQGLYKTNETTKTFENILKTTQNQKQRRHQLLGLLQKCIKRRVQYQHKKQQLRALMIQQAKNQQQKTHFQQQLQLILSDGDINSYKQIGNALGKCQNDRVKLIRLKNIIDNQLQQMDRQVVGLATKIQDQYQDILCQIIPSDYQYSLKNGQDVKRIRNYLRKMYKRLGILKNQ